MLILDSALGYEMRCFQALMIFFHTSVVIRLQHSNKHSAWIWVMEEAKWEISVRFFAQQFYWGKGELHLCLTQVQDKGSTCPREQVFEALQMHVNLNSLRKGMTKRKWIKLVCQSWKSGYMSILKLYLFIYLLTWNKFVG